MLLKYFHKIFGLVRYRLNLAFVAEIRVNIAYGLYPLVCFGVIVDVWGISLAQFNEELGENDPLHSFINVVQYG